jgi:peptide/nickel transport system ATP-binding protein
MAYQRPGGESVRPVDGVSLQVEPGEIVGLVGESGCGKSTVARAVVGLLQPAAGRITFRGNEVRSLTRRSQPRKLVGLQMVSQNPYSCLNPRRTVGAQLLEAVAAGTGRRRATHEEIAELLQRVGLAPSAADRYPYEFSGGQRQRIADARVLAVQPSVIVADEPLPAPDATAAASAAHQQHRRRPPRQMNCRSGQ